MSIEEKDSIDYLIDDIDEETGKEMEKHNMHTISGKNVAINKISELCIDEKDDMFSIVKYMFEKTYEKYDELSIQESNDLYYLRGLKNFFDFANEKEYYKTKIDNEKNNLEILEEKNNNKIVDSTINHEKTAYFHDQKSELYYTEQKIGKTTINASIQSKDKAYQKVKDIVNERDINSNQK